MVLVMGTTDCVLDPEAPDDHRAREGRSRRFPDFGISSLTRYHCAPRPNLSTWSSLGRNICPIKAFAELPSANHRSLVKLHRLRLFHRCFHNANRAVGRDDSSQFQPG